MADFTVGHAASLSDGRHNRGFPIPTPEQIRQNQDVRRAKAQVTTSFQLARYLAHLANDDRAECPEELEDEFKQFMVEYFERG